MKLLPDLPIAAVEPGSVHRLVDAMLDHVEASHPGHEYVIALPLGAAPFLPRDDDRLWRIVDSELVALRRHVYRALEAVTYEPLEDWQIVAGPTWDLRLAAAPPGLPPVYLGDLRTGVLAVCRHPDATR
ncbi:hypothetical protein [Nocardioides alkalitolerans]|uniref:hypothetical protein n=1 Tax=Nocardioides alkalitolerans TaxID=281714 RepID=UPI0004912CD3|nr:hypothetical protein [Nocardioides alkalitolerans]